MLVSNKSSTGSFLTQRNESHLGNRRLFFHLSEDKQRKKLPPLWTPLGCSSLTKACVVGGDRDRAGDRGDSLEI